MGVFAGKARKNTQQFSLSEISLSFDKNEEQTNCHHSNRADKVRENRSTIGEQHQGDKNTQDEKNCSNYIFNHFVTLSILILN